MGNVALAETLDEERLLLQKEKNDAKTYRRRVELLRLEHEHAMQEKRINNMYELNQMTLIEKWLEALQGDVIYAWKFTFAVLSISGVVYYCFKTYFAYRQEVENNRAQETRMKEQTELMKVLKDFDAQKLQQLPAIMGNAPAMID